MNNPSKAGSRNTGRVSALLPLVLFSAFIFVMSSLSAPPTPTFDLDWGDKIIHAGAYGLMMIFAVRAARWILWDRGVRTQLLAALAYTVLFGLSDEIHQSFVPSRHYDPYDLLADAAGGIIAAVVIAIILPTRAGRRLFAPRPGPV